MKQFVYKSIFCFLALLAIHFVLALNADGTSDYYYKRFTSPQQASMVLGTSRAAQGIIPSVIDSVLDNEQLASGYNFSFTLQNSPYGKVYYEAVKKKLLTNKNGYFILCVDPWALSTIDEAVLIKEHDKNSILNNTTDFSSKPNLSYLLNNYKKGWGQLILKKIENILLTRNSNSLSKTSGSWAEVKDDGWLEVNTSMEANYVKRNTEKKTKSYLPLASDSQLSSYRMNWLQKQIEFLKNHGEVYLVRLPVHQKLVTLENKLSPDFDTKMEGIASEKSIPYINLINESDLYAYTDGNHLYKTSAIEVSQKIATRIRAVHMHR